MFNRNKYDIVSIGSATRDVFMSGDSLKAIKDPNLATGEALYLGLGSKIEIKKLVVASGGGGGNAAVTFARQGLKTACIGVIGNDLNGKEIQEELKSEGVDISYFQKHSDDMSAYSVILVHGKGERTILSYKGEGQHFEARKVPFNTLGSKWLYLDSLGGHYDLLESALDWAVKNKVQVAADPGGKELDHGIEKLKPLFQNCSILHMNQEEAAKLTGIDYRQEKELFKYMDGLVKGIFLMSKGPEGVVASDGKNIYRAAVPDSPVVERTGAGDAFTSGFVVEYARSGDVVKAIQFGTANASSVVTQYGSKAGILKKGDWGPWPLVKVNMERLS